MIETAMSILKISIPIFAIKLPGGNMSRDKRVKSFVQLIPGIPPGYRELSMAKKSNLII